MLCHPCSNTASLNWSLLDKKGVYRLPFLQAGVKTTTGLSLNDTLLVGATMQRSLFVILVGFRMHNIILTTDSEKMYRQFLVPEHGRQYQRIFWRYGEGKLIVHELTTPQIIKILATLGLEYDGKCGINELRRILRTHVSDVNKETGNKESRGEVIDNSGESEVIHTMAEGNGNNNAKLEFQLGKDDWETYAERLELYFVANDVKTEKRAAVLLTKISADTYKLVRDLCAPDKPSTKTFEELVKLIGSHLNPKPSETMERYTFYQAQQAMTESVADFAARLKRLSINCKFVETKVALRDQFVCGLKDHETKKALFREEKLTYDLAYKIATALETAERNAVTTDKTTEEPSKSTVNMIQSNTKTERRPFYPSARGRGAIRGSRQGQRYKSTAPVNKRKQGPNDEPNKGKLNAQHLRQGSCYCCGKTNHWARDCFHRHRTCNTCKRRGHLATVCRSRLQHLKQEDEAEGHQRRESTSDDFFMVRGDNKRKEWESIVGNIGSISNELKADPMYVNVIINDIKVKMEVDTGSYAAIISKYDKDRMFPSLGVKATYRPLKAYGKVPLEQVGELQNLNVKVGDKEALLRMIVMKERGPILIGREWLKVFGMWPFKFNCNERGIGCNKIELIDMTKDFGLKFPKLFGKGPGLYNKGMLKLTLKENAQPVALKARHLPFALTNKVEDEINRLVKLQHLEKVDVSEWATPIVPVIKSDGSVRICGNFKLTLNPQLVKDRHPIPLIDEIFLALRNGKKFSQIDLEHAYMQIPVEESSRDYLTIITHKGLYRYTKMTEGVASGPGDFQRKIEQCLAGIDGVIPYLDNIFCTGRDDKEHLQTLYKVFTRLEDSGFKVNLNKCEAFKERLDILGFVIDKDGLHKSETKVKAMIEAPTPVNKKQLDSFLGLITYYARFLPNRAEKLKPLYECAKNGEYKWTKECEQAFKWVKSEIVSPRVLAHFDPKEDIILSCDASAYGLGAILSHRYRDGTERPIAFASKIIPEKERSRAIIDKEASAIVYGFKKFYNYIYGKEITLRTDHKPLVFIFGPKQEIPLTTASRLQRWAYFLSRFSYKMEYVKSEKNVFGNEFTTINYVEEALDTVNAAEIVKETKRDQVLSKIVRYVNGSWPSMNDMNEIEKKYYTKRDEYSVEKGCLLWGYRIVVPVSVREKVLRELHASHFGIVKMKMVARSYVWWPNIDSDIEKIAASFIDAYSKWPEMIDMGKSTTAPRVIEVFKKILVRFGLPRHLVTDNGTQYKSEEFQKFCRDNGIKQSFTPPHHPATNGAAENFVETFKDKVDKIVRSGRTPAFMMYKRELRTRFDLLRPSVRDDVADKQLAQVTRKKGSRKAIIYENYPTITLCLKEAGRMLHFVTSAAVMMSFMLSQVTVTKLWKILLLIAEVKYNVLYENNSAVSTFQAIAKMKMNGKETKQMTISPDANTGYVQAILPYYGSLATENLVRPDLPVSSRIVLDLYQKVVMWMVTQMLLLRGEDMDGDSNVFGEEC
ncbi:uncharacterized protein LOC122404149 [Colletes gigas]|uniref:uncharacterized protein LOC122404149 n=1 Tax=Colletes gigas TaxID=935657 RepID=UPI001C9B026C|nr:uncharacterized protein LOC122404149 [Colletes gigas]